MNRDAEETGGAGDVRDVREYGATGDGESLDTEAIQGALDDCAASGGTVVVPPGTYTTAPLTVGDDTTLDLRAGATLSFVRDHEAFPAKESRWEGWDQTGFHPCLLVEDAENVEITGRGTVDGQGDYWWQFYGVDDDELPDDLAERLAEFDAANDRSDDVSSFTLRPPLFQVSESENVSVSGVTLRNSPFWNTHVVYSEDVTLHDLTIENPADAPNGDGIDVDSSRFVRISDTYINAGDDAICLKSGKDEEGRRVGRPCENVVVTNCTVEAGHGGVVVGSETAGDVRHVTVTNCTFTGTDRGIRIKSTRGRGGTVEDLRFDTIVMRRVACPFVINGYYQTDIDSDPVAVDESTPAVRDVHFHHVTAKEVESAAFLTGLPERRFGGITFDDVDIEATRSFDATDLSPAMAKGYEQQHGMFCKSLDDVSFNDVRVTVPDGTPLTVEESTAVTLDGFETEGGAPPAVRAVDVELLRLRGCTAPDGGDAFARVGGDAPGAVSLGGNYGPLSDAVVVDEGADIEVRE
ncbi:glycoside hydrolase family 28 protein [Candidatus Halobonum tyrrellensis]|uniref:Exo-poly-alpha-D-galacturonosidase n=1 Tax=Candidatus Halobonum tyrrellensis G22 TaxID=1324957 RepID=V4J478_9EURY|nr:glycoside hydrolase family 28 protein [Candidatus Halobonum tyrrellensis]ESP90177.1 exo-poly-alpha-D-galacturonosidase precursor [Candidatus Halobonum tyrrellensis G22]